MRTKDELVTSLERACQEKFREYLWRSGVLPEIRMNPVLEDISSQWPKALVLTEKTLSELITELSSEEEANKYTTTKRAHLETDYSLQMQYVWTLGRNEAELREALTSAHLEFHRTRQGLYLFAWYDFDAENCSWHLRQVDYLSKRVTELLQERLHPQEVTFQPKKSLMQVPRATAELVFCSGHICGADWYGRETVWIYSEDLPELQEAYTTVGKFLKENPTFLLPLLL